MAELPQIGKISPEFFNEVIFPHLGARRRTVLIGPEHGVDVGVVDIGGRAVAMTTDPVFIVPEYGFERAAWFAIHILASDVVTSGLPPTYLAIDLNLPMSMTKAELSVVWQTIDRECKKMGMGIVCGHTGRYDNCQYPMVGGATVLAVGELDQYVSPKFARPGDRIIISKGPAIEASGIFAAMFPRLLNREFGARFARRAESLFFKMSVVKDAMTAVRAGVRDEGVSSMHDATECGVWGGLYEVAGAAGVGLRVEKDRIVVEDCVEEICRLFKIDPFQSISEGTLIITCRESNAGKVVELLSLAGIRSSVVGELTTSRHGMVLIENGKERRLKHPRVDPFWKVFYSALAEHADLEGG